MERFNNRSLGQRLPLLPLQNHRVRLRVDPLLGAVFHRVRLIARRLANRTHVPSQNGTRTVAAGILKRVARINRLRFSVVAAELALDLRLGRRRWWWRQNGWRCSSNWTRSFYGAPLGAIVAQQLIKVTPGTGILSVLPKVLPDVFQAARSQVEEHFIGTANQRGERNELVDGVLLMKMGFTRETEEVKIIIQRDLLTRTNPF